MPNSYGTLEGANAYHSERGNTQWTGADTAKNQALLRASIYVDNKFRARFPGEKTNGRLQDREWPRLNAYDIEDELIASDVVPVEAIEATYEAALRELVEPNSLQPDYIAGQIEKRTKVDVIEVEYFGATGAAAVTPVLTIIGGILAPILTGSNPNRTYRT